MKASYALAVMILSSIYSFGQCDTLIEVVTDKVTGVSNLNSKNVIIIGSASYGFGIYIMNAQKSTIINMKALGASPCIDESSKMNILFRDGTRLEMSNDADFNCKHGYTLYFGDIFKKENEAQYFASKEIETMRVWTMDGHVEKDFTPRQSAAVMNTFACLRNAVK